ncbi:putative hydrolase of the HAD superfamily [Actinokineospora baliensis]|uniref:HAD family hydrolase n=1 Tax=Actinokineospora baliensis TaxID=547056 RepID=UPI0027DAF64C|nr:HAD family hydrolase [Actinokineospora baliensis]MBM7770272.1 putative hydrolase of the HAD superfamily [Actinokineospora baliensis]
MIFDWGGTLTPWVTIDHLAAWRAYADVLHPDDESAASTLAATVFAAESAAWLLVRDEHRAFTLAQVLEGVQAPFDEQALQAFRGYWDQATHTDPDVAPMLTGLRERGLRTGVLSSTAWPAAWHEEVLHRDGVLDLFHARVWSSDLEYTKPHRAAFEAAMAAVGVDDPADCVYVGDRPYDDISGAKAVGMRTIFVPHSDIPLAQQVPVEVTPDAVVQRLSELPAVVDRWLT